jgi:hypothetical protein
MRVSRSASVHGMCSEAYWKARSESAKALRMGGLRAMLMPAAAASRNDGSPRGPLLLRRSAKRGSGEHAAGAVSMLALRAWRVGTRTAFPCEAVMDANMKSCGSRPGRNAVMG